MALRIDAHHHVWDLARRPQPWTDDLSVLRRSFGFAELAPQLARQDVVGTVVVQTVASADETRELLALAHTEPLVSGVVGWLDLEAADVEDAVSALRDLPGGRHLVGARHQLQLEPDPEWLGRPSVRRGLAALSRHGLVYDLVVSPFQLPTVTRVVADLPDVAFVLDHAGKPAIGGGDLATWTDDIAALAKLDNVAVKLSGLVTEASWTAWTVADLQPAADVVLSAFGADRVMFGSDWPVCLLAEASYDRVVASAEALLAGLSPTERDLVWGGVARQVYRLEAG